METYQQFWQRYLTRVLGLSYLYRNDEPAIELSPPLQDSPQQTPLRSAEPLDRPRPLEVGDPTVEDRAPLTKVLFVGEEDPKGSSPLLRKLQEALDRPCEVFFYRPEQWKVHRDEIFDRFAVIVILGYRLAQRMEADLQPLHGIQRVGWLASHHSCRILITHGLYELVHEPQSKIVVWKHLKSIQALLPPQPFDQLCEDEAPHS